MAAATVTTIPVVVLVLYPGRPGGPAQRGPPLVQVGTPEALYRHPVDPFAATFIGSPPMNLIPARLQAEAGELFAMVADFRLALPDRLKSKAEGLTSRQVMLGIRPEHLRLAQNGLLAGTVRYTEYLGREVIYRLDVAGHEVLVLTDRRELEIGQVTGLNFGGEDLHLFPAG